MSERLGAEELGGRCGGIGSPEKECMGDRGQIVGKSTLINSIRKILMGGKIMHLIEALVPCTTLGIIRLEGIFPMQAKLFDTLGPLHPHQITARLTREEHKLVHITAREGKWLCNTWIY